MLGHAGSGSRKRFDRGSIFSDDTVGLPAADPPEAPGWLAEVRSGLAGNGPHLAWDTGDEIRIAAVPEGFTHIGRSLQADIRLSDPTVSRRHAVIHRSGADSVVLDDHSLNGVFVGGERVEWHPLSDGDEIQIGGLCIHFIAGVRAPSPHAAGA